MASAGDFEPSERIPVATAVAQPKWH